MIKIELEESEARELLAAVCDCGRLWFDKMEAIEARYGSNAAKKIFYDDEYRNVFFHAAKLVDIGSKIEDSLNKE